jgi:L-methionine (R)-S-oxide reductase
MKKQELYKGIIGDVISLTENIEDNIANYANISSLLFYALADINWAGFYLLKDEQLILGPFQGRPACVAIPLGKGVCGTAAEKRKTIIVPDVHTFPGHIACDPHSRSEIVVPMIKNNKLMGVLDIDSPLPDRFDMEDAYFLEKIVALIT